MEVLGRHVRDIMVHRKRQPQSLREAIHFGVSGSLNFKCSATHCPRSWYVCWKHCCGDTRLWHMHSDQRKCVVHIMCGATAGDHEFSQAEDACGQAWRQTHHGSARRQRAPAARCAPRLTAQTDRACTIPLRIQHGPTVAQSSNLSRKFYGGFHEHFFSVSKARGRGRRLHTPIWQRAPNKLVPHKKLLGLFRLAMYDHHHTPPTAPPDRSLLLTYGHSSCVWSQT